MAKVKLNKKSLMDMIDSFDHELSKELMEESRTRSDRLEFLNKSIGLPYPKPTVFSATDVANQSTSWKSFFKKNQDELCAFRLLPKPGSSAKKKRARGKSVKQTLAWFEAECDDPEQYDLFVMPHMDPKKWSTTFVVNEHGVFGEIIKGHHTQLTQGYREEGELMSFSFDISSGVVHLDQENADATEHIKSLVEMIRVQDKTTKKQVSKKLGSSFHEDYLLGYFETVHSEDGATTWFIDYSAVLGKEYKDFTVEINTPRNEHSQDSIAKLFNSQISQTEWFERVSHDDRVKYKDENLNKTKRLLELHDVLGVPIDKPHDFSVDEVLGGGTKFMKFQSENKGHLCGVRLSPKDITLPKLRMRRLSIDEGVEWIRKQDINPDQYSVSFFKFAPDNKWSAVFVVNKHGIHGEIIEGDLSPLLRGVYLDEKPVSFSYDFKDWVKSPGEKFEKALMSFLTHMEVRDDNLQAELASSVGATFSSGYINGYFEVIETEMYGLRLLDYNRIIGEMYEDFKVSDSDGTGSLLSGMTASGGYATGPVRIVRPEQVAKTDFKEGEVLVCEMTTPDYLPLMKKCAAIITDQGGILSHAAIVARELKKPCIVGTDSATSLLREGQVVTVEGDKGLVLVKA